MLIQDIPYHLRNTVERLELPIYLDLTPRECRPPRDLALGDTLMLLGLIRNQGRPIKLHMDPGPARELVQGHPLVAELLPPGEPSRRFKLLRVPVGRAGRPLAWVSGTTHTLPLPVLPVDQVRGNPVLAHSLYYRLENTDDRPSVFLDPARTPALAGLLSRRRPTLVVFPLNPGRRGHYWRDLAWWRELMTRARRDMAVVAVGGRDYGELADAADHCLSMDDPSSTLLDLAWLMGRAAAFAGGDGGLSHLALAVQPRVLTLWDSVSSYRFWASAQGHHLLFCNPYGFRYPQTRRLSLTDVRRLAAQMAGPGAPPWQAQGLEAWAGEQYGGVEGLARAVLAWQEVAEERGFVEDWMGLPELKARIYQESLDFALAALAGRLPAGANWVAPAACPPSA